MARHIDGKDAWCGLRHYHYVHELLTVHPLVVVDKLALHYWNHGVTSAQCEGSYLIARKKKL